MKRNTLLILLLASALLVVADAQTTIFKNSGAYARSNFPNIGVFVGNGEFAGGTNQPFLNYSTFTPNPDGSYSYSSGYGNIPNSAFTAKNVDRMSLNVDTSQIAGFQAETCNVIFQPTYSSTCTAGPFGVIQLDWQQNGYSSTITKQDLTATNGPVTTSMRSDSTFASGDASGTFLGTPVVDNASQLGTDKSRDIIITKGK
jgi:hypothetical protein